jgi:hypothetical protein
MTGVNNKVLELLREQCESEAFTGWRMVYLDNVSAKLPELNGKQFAAHLSVLKKAGLYRDDDEYKGIWGYVKKV